MPISPALIDHLPAHIASNSARAVVAVQLAPRDDPYHALRLAQAAVTEARARFTDLAVANNGTMLAMDRDLLAVFPTLSRDPERDITDLLIALSPIARPTVALALGNEPARNLIKDAGVAFDEALVRRDPLVISYAPTAYDRLDAPGRSSPPPSRIEPVTRIESRGVSASHHTPGIDPRAASAAARAPAPMQTPGGLVVPSATHITELLVQSDVQRLDALLANFEAARHHLGTTWPADLVSQAHALSTDLGQQLETRTLPERSRIETIKAVVDEVLEVTEAERPLANGGQHRGRVRLACIPAFGKPMLVMTSDDGSIVSHDPDRFPTLQPIDDRVYISYGSDDRRDDRFVLERDVVNSIDRVVSGRTRRQ